MWLVSVPESVYFWRNSDKRLPVLPDNKDDRNCTEMSNLLVCSTSLPGKVDCINVKMNDVTMYGRSANL